MAVLLVGIYSEGSVWLVREVRQVLRLLGVGNKMKHWVDCNMRSLLRKSVPHDFVFRSWTCYV